MGARSTEEWLVAHSTLAHLAGHELPGVLASILPDVRCNSLMGVGQRQCGFLRRVIHSDCVGHV